MAGYSEITAVGFGLAGDAEIERASFKKITSYELFAPDGQPVPGGVPMITMSPGNRRMNCEM